MTYRALALLALGLCSTWLRTPAAALQAAAPPEQTVVADQVTDPEWDLEFDLSLAQLPADAEVVVAFDTGPDAQRTELHCSRSGVRLASVTGDQVTDLAPPVKLPDTAAATRSVVLRRRADRVGVIVDLRLVLTVWVPGRTGGPLQITAPPQAVNADSVLLQAVVPPEWSDEFMRSSDEGLGEWEVLSGSWDNTALVEKLKFVPRAANPFAFAAKAAPKAMAAAGSWFWSDCTYRAAVRGTAEGIIGLAFYVQDADNYWLLRMTSVSYAGPGPGPGLAQVVRVVGGQPQVMGEARHGYVPQQWYELKVSTRDDLIRAFVDDVPVARVREGTFAQGRVGLYAEQCEAALFDDVRVTPWTDVTDDFEAPSCGRWGPADGAFVQVPPEGDRSGYLAKQPGKAGLAFAGRCEAGNCVFEVDLALEGDAPVGIPFAYVDDANWWRYTLYPGKQARQELVRRVAGKDEVLATGPLPPSDQRWRHVRVLLQDQYVCAQVDSVPPLEAVSAEPLAGWIGLWGSEAARAQLDNVSLAPAPQYVPARLPTTMVEDPEMKEQFANPAEGWFTVTDPSTRPQGSPMAWNKGEYFPPSKVEFPIANVVAGAGTVRVTICGSEEAPQRGYHLELSKEANVATLRAVLLAGTVEVGRAEAQVGQTQPSCAVRFQKSGTYVLAFVDDHLLLSYREQGQAIPGRDDSQRPGGTQDEAQPATP